MSFDYLTLQADAAEILQEFGQTLQIKSAAPGGTYDPVEDVTTPSGPAVTTDFWGVPLNITEEYSRAVGTENIRERDQLVYMEGGKVVPKMNDEILINDEWWQVVNIVEINPAGVPVLYILQVHP